MTGEGNDSVSERVASARPERRLRRASVAIGRVVFGDRTGLTIWLGLVLALGLGLRVGFFITDTYPIANAVYNLAEGRLAMRPTDFQYSLTLGTQPGLHEYDGAFYARNYGQVVAAVPVLFVLEGLSTIGEPRLVLAAGWSLGVLLFGRSLAKVLDRPVIRRVASVVAAVSFLAALSVATALPREQLPLVALQLSTLLVTGMVGVLGYRLLGLFHERRVAVVGGVGLVTATPVAFWATIPKRHVFVTALLIASVYAFALSRTREGIASDLTLGSAYGLLGLIAWIHAFEGFFLVVSLFVVDLATEPRKGKRRLAITAGLFALSLLPMLVTNVLISGNPLRPPRLLYRVGAGSVELAPEQPAAPTGEAGVQGGESSSGSGSETGGGPGLFGPVLTLLALFETAVTEAKFVSEYAAVTVEQGVRAVTEPTRLWNVFVRRGHGQYGGVNSFEPIDLSVVESTPLLGALLALPALAVASVRRGIDAAGGLAPRHQTDLLVGTHAVVLAFVYLPRLPLFSQLTVRYLLPATALGVYGVVRLSAVRDAIEGEPRTLLATYGTVLIAGAGGLCWGLDALEPAVGEAIQFHATVGLVVASALALAVVARMVVPARVSSRPVAVGLGLAGGATTLFVVFATVEYFTYGPFVLDVIGGIARHVTVI